MRCYDLMTLEIISENNCGENFKEGDYPLEVCDKVSGFFLESIATEIRPWAVETKEYCEDLEASKNAKNK